MSGHNHRSFTERVALVTNGASGIGRAVALQLALQGAYVIVNYDDAEGESVALELRELGTLAHAVRADISRAADVRLLFGAIEETFGRLDLLVNNAALNREAAFDELTEEAWDEALGSLLKGAFLCARAAVPLMWQRPSPSIVNVVSEAAWNGSAGGANFAAAGAGLIGLTKALARELAPRVRVNAVAVGGASDEAAVKADDPLHAFQRQDVANEKSARRTLPPDEVARACLYLLSSDARFITGQTLVIGSRL